MFAKFHLSDHNPWFFRRYVSACMRSLIFVKYPNYIIKEIIIVLKLVDTMLEPDFNIKVERLRTPISKSRIEIPRSPCHTLGARLWYETWTSAFRSTMGVHDFVESKAYSMNAGVNKCSGLLSLYFFKSLLCILNFVFEFINSPTVVQRSKRFILALNFLVKKLASILSSIVIDVLLMQGSNTEIDFLWIIKSWSLVYR